MYDDLFEGGCAVIDIGGRTTDIAVINPQGGTMQTSRCGTLDVGIITLKSILNQNIKAKIEDVIRHIRLAIYRLFSCEIQFFDQTFFHFHNLQQI